MAENWKRFESSCEFVISTKETTVLTYGSNRFLNAKRQSFPKSNLLIKRKFRMVDDKQAKKTFRQNKTFRNVR